MQIIATLSIGEGYEGMSPGFHKYRDAKQVDQLPGMLALPFVGTITGYAINRREWGNNSEK